MLVAHFVQEFGERSGIRGIHGINAIRVDRNRNASLFHTYYQKLANGGSLAFSFVARWHDVIAAT